MYSYLNDLEPLEDVLHEIKVENDFHLYDEETILEITETILHLMDEYIEHNPSAISEPDFNEEIVENIKDLLYEQLNEQHIMFDYDDMEELDNIIYDSLELFLSTFYNERSAFSNNHIELDINNNQDINNKEVNEEKEKIRKQLEILHSKPQPTQRTTEWYEFRRNLITASNAYKAFESQSFVNQLIYEKCQPIKQNDDDKPSMVNISTPFHWGQKYEPISVSIYEHLYKTKVADFGCIQHDVYKFLGASPDGINVDPSSHRYGRMLEIKNIVNREINGIPKKEYWIQMQLQMEVCNLDLCDFLETKFTEYENYNSYLEDSSTDAMKGTIMYFHTIEGKPFYIYKPIEMKDTEEIEKWEEENMDKYQSDEFKMVWIKNIYWKLEKISCVLVQRNKKWFEDNISQLERVWKIIEQERISGYEHRAPNKKMKKSKESEPEIQNQCLINIDKITGKTVVENKGTILQFLNKPPQTILQEEHDDTSGNTDLVIKIRTESIDETKDRLN